MLTRAASSCGTGVVVVSLLIKIIVKLLGSLDTELQVTAFWPSVDQKSPTVGVRIEMAEAEATKAARMREGNMVMRVTNVGKEEGKK